MDAPPSSTGSANDNLSTNANPNMRRPHGPQGRMGGGGFGYFGNPMLNFMMPGMFNGSGTSSEGNPLFTTLQYLQSLSYLIYSLGQMFDMIGMNANSIINGYNMIYNMVQKLIHIAKTSHFRKWMQSKSKKSKVVRFLFVILSMVATSLAMRLFHFLSVYMDMQNHGRIVMP